MHLKHDIINNLLTHHRTLIFRVMEPWNQLQDKSDLVIYRNITCRRLWWKSYAFFTLFLPWISRWRCHAWNTNVQHNVLFFYIGIITWKDWHSSVSSSDLWLVISCPCILFVFITFRNRCRLHITMILIWLILA